jgi:hypothetical protein
VKDGVHTNGLENFWSLLKRTVKGTHVHVAPFHLFRYLDDQTSRFDERKESNQARFVSAIITVKIAGYLQKTGGQTRAEVSGFKICAIAVSNEFIAHSPSRRDFMGLNSLCLRWLRAPRFHNRDFLC